MLRLRNTTANDTCRDTHADASQCQCVARLSRSLLLSGDMDGRHAVGVCCAAQHAYAGRDRAMPHQHCSARSAALQNF